MQWLKHFVTTCLVFLFVASVYAAPSSSSSQIWTLPALTDYALSHNPNTTLAWAQVQAAAANVGITRSAYWPTIDVTADVSRTTPVSNDDDDDDFGCSSDDKFCGAVTLNYLLWDFGATRAEVKSAKYQLLSTQFTRNSILQTTILQVEQAYYQLLGEQELLTANQVSVQEAKTSLDAAQALHDHGLSTIGDVYQAQSTLAQAQLVLDQTQGALAIAQGQLAIAVGLPVQTKLKLQPLPPHLNTKTTMQNIDKLLQQAKTMRPDLLAAEAQISAQQAAVSALQRQRWPTLALQAGTENADPMSNNNFNENRQNNIMITLNYPLFTGFERSNQIKQAQALATQTQAEKDQLALTVDNEVWQAYYNLQVAQQSIDTSQAYLKASTHAAQQTLGQYKAGVGDILSVLTTQTTEASARVEAIQSVLNWYLALAQLMQAIGILQIPSSYSSNI